MRIVGGAFRSRALRVPSGKLTRPTTERVREAVFNILGASVQGTCVLDLYAGSGSLGIEALSRGARRAVFVEQAPQAASVLHANLQSLSIDDPAVAQIVRRSIEPSIPTLRSVGPFDLCLVDPPFAAVRDGSALRAVELVVSAGVFAQGATLVLEIPSDQPDPALCGLDLVDVRGYGDTRVVYYQCGE